MGSGNDPDLLVADFKEAAAKKLEEARKRLKELESKINKTKEDAAAVEKAKNLVKHLQKKQMKQAKTIVKKQKVTNNKELFTFIMNFLGGTYIDQVVAANEIQAMQLWIQSLKIDEIKGFTYSNKKGFFFETKEL